MIFELTDNLRFSAEFADDFTLSGTDGLRSNQCWREYPGTHGAWYSTVVVR